MGIVVVIRGGEGIAGRARNDRNWGYARNDMNVTISPALALQGLFF